jgi:Uma2 family endonuclease
MIVRLPFDRTKRLTGDGVALVVEVAHSSREDDLTDKRGKYAAAGIPEYWVVDVAARVMHVFRAPKAGDYPDPTVYEPGQSIAPVFAPRLCFAIDDLV